MGGSINKLENELGNIRGELSGIKNMGKTNESE